ncbi:MAG: cysteine desulfurase [Burkholderiaceae bacterium]|nr:cysteine desulfurase [Burkholderiaceae bacterium]
MPGANFVPSSPTPVLSLANRVAHLTPNAQAGNGVPDRVYTTVPGYAPRTGAAIAQDVPQARDATATAAAQHPAGTAAASPFYFVGDGHGHPSAGGADSAALSNATPGKMQVDDALVLQALNALRGGDQAASASPAAADAAAAAPAPLAARPAASNNPAGTQRLPDATALTDSASWPEFVSVPSLPGNAPAHAAPAAGLPGNSDNPAHATAASKSQYYFVDAVTLPDGHVTPAKPALRDGGGSIPLAGQDRHAAFDIHAVRRDFPILQERIHGRQLIWFDNAATTHKPQAVIDRLGWFYAHENSNIHRAAHDLAARATDAYEGARETVRRFINAPDVNEVIFARGTTEAINLVAKSWGWQHIGEGDEIIVSHLEHHANIVPWQQLAAAKGARLRVIPVDDDGQVLLDEYQKLLGDRTKLVAVTQVSNALGTVVPVRKIVELAHRAGARALVDGAQSIAHMRVDVQDMDADFFVFSGHKIFGPTGIGALWGKREVLEDMPPWQGGGNMIADVTFEKTIFQPIPNKFEAGTGNIADAVGLGAALDYVSRLGLENIARYEHDLLAYGMAQLRTIKGLRLIGTAPDKASVLSFVLAGYSTDEVGQALNQEGIAVRTGHHCAQPILRRFGLESTVRPSLAFYNTFDEIDCMTTVLRRLAARR